MKKLMAANWKMFKTRQEAVATAQTLMQLTAATLPSDREVVLFPPFTAIQSVADVLEGTAGISLGGQNFFPEKEGAYTGEISVRMLEDIGAEYGLTGHSERRHLLGEDDDLIGQKTSYGVDSGLKIILCVGEKINERQEGQVEAVLERQIRLGLKNVSLDIPPENISIAYEPVWAIGTGEVAGCGEIEEAHTFVRKILLSIFGEKASEIRILYGGSVNKANCADIIALDNVDGVLVGGASLDGESFSQIVLAGS